MESTLHNDALPEFENMSRSDRWLAFRKYLLKLNESISAAADVANEEAQREISLTLNNDFEYDACFMQAAEKDPAEFGKERLLAELAKLPNIGAKAAQDIADYAALAQDAKVLDFAHALAELNANITPCESPVQSTLDLD